ncbi:MAG: glycosyltransferase [Ignavibacteriae bacterium]|nr:glycosyltransferase [Ignavibacteriota bacterium]
MNILFITSSLPHQFSGHGSGVLLYQTIRQLTKRHQVTIISFCDKQEQQFTEELKSKLPVELFTVPRGKGAQESIYFTFYLILIRLYQLFRSVIFWQPYVVSKYYHPRMGQLIEKVTSEKQFDVVQFEFTHMGQYQQFVRSGRVVLDELDVTYRPAYRLYKKQKQPFKKFFAYVEWCRWKKFELRLIQQCHHILTITEQDRLLLQWLSKNNNISYFRRGVDIPVELTQKRIPHTILFIGSFSHQPNVDAVRWLVHEIFPLVNRKFPDVVCTIIGKNPPQDVVNASEKNSGIKALGFVEDIRQYLHSCSVFVAPLRYGGGVKIKILEAMAHGIPVVTTKIGAEGIDGISSESVILGETPVKIASHICNLFDDPQRAETLARNAYENIVQHYSWEVVIERLEKIYGKILSN